MNKSILILITVIITWPVFCNNLKNVSEDSGKTINLARTSLALVSASSCNGDRPISNKFYGILNAFDGESNWINKINYSYWMPNCNEEEWIEVEFSNPVSLTSLKLAGSTQCNATLYFEKGREKVFPKIVPLMEEPTRSVQPLISSTYHLDTKKADANLKFEEVMIGVRKVRLTFLSNNSRLNELQIMGFPPEGKKYKVGKPRLKVTEKDSLLAANDAYRNWLERTWKSERS